MLQFSLDKKSVPVKLGEKKYTLKEMSGKQRDEYLNQMGDKMTIVNGKVTAMKDYTGVYSSLISYTLYDDNDVLVPLETIESFPASVQSSLFREAQKLNGMDDESAEQVKND